MPLPRHPLAAALSALAFLCLAASSASPAFAHSRAEVRTSVGFELPRGAVTIHVGSRPYYSHRGVFYERGRHGFIVTHAPFGAFVRELPPGYVRIDYRGQPYYRCDDIYYRPTRGGYIIVDAPLLVRRARVAADAPDAAKTAQEEDPYARYPSVRVGDQELRIKSGQFFRETDDGLVWQEAPLGETASELPAGAVSVWYRDDEYFECEEVHFRKTPRGFKIVASPWDTDATATDAPAPEADTASAAAERS